MNAKMVFVASMGVLLLSACGKKEQTDTPATANQQSPAAASKPEGIQPAMRDTSQQMSMPEKKVVKQQPQIVQDENGRFTIQVSSWRTRRMAEKEAAKYRAMNLDAFIEEAFLPDKDGTWFRVRIGRFATLADARAYQQNQLSEVLDDGSWIDLAKK